MRWTTSPGVAAQRVDEQLVIHVPSERGFVDLDPSGTELWTVLEQGGWDDDAVVAHLVDTYGMDETQATEVTRAFLDQLERHRVITRA